VGTTAAASSTSQYWGRRIAAPNGEGEPPDPRVLTIRPRRVLEERAPQPDLRSVTNADPGLYSTPSYHLDAEVVTATDRCVAIRIDSDLARPVIGTATLPLSTRAGARRERRGGVAAGRATLRISESPSRFRPAECWRSRPAAYRTRGVRRVINPSLKASSEFLAVFFARFPPGYL
jgi:hypothetical protein